MTDTCRKGHERTPENTYVTSRGVRVCRVCARANQARKQAEFKAIIPRADLGRVSSRRKGPTP